MTYIKGLLFYKDGTLFDFHHTWSVWCHRFISEMAQSDKIAAERLAQALDFNMLSREFRPNSPVIAGTLEILVEVTLKTLPDLGAQTIRQGILDTATHAQMVPVVPLIPLLDGFLQDGLRLGVATNDGEAPARVHLQSQGIHDHFHYVAGYDTGHGEKPAPGMLLAFCEACSLDPSEVAMIGDSTHDLHSAAAAGMKRVGVLTGIASHDDLYPHADIVLPDIGHLPAWLRSLST